jgi:hypothetical protein
MTIARQPQGIPAGGQFAATAHAEPQITLPPGSASAEDFVRERDALRERRDQAKEYAGDLDRLAQRVAIRGAASTILTEYPDAATLRISENPDGENQYDVISITAADGRTLAHVDDGDDWEWQEMTSPNGPSIQEFIYDLDLRDNSWADGIGTITGGKRDFKSVDIDLHAALSASLPEDPELA